MEIIFVNDGWATAAWACAAIFFGAFLVFYGLSVAEEKGAIERRQRYRFNRKRYILGWTVALIVLYPVANAGTWMGSQYAPDSRTAQLSEVSDQVGIESGKVYPLILGDTYSGIVGEAEARAGIFTASATVDIRPTTVINIAFQRDKYTWQLLLPSGVTPYIDGEEPSVTIWLNDSTLAEKEARWNLTWPECEWQLRNLWVVCIRPSEPTERLWVSDDFKNQPLPGFVEKYFSRAEIVITPKQRDILFPNN